MDKYEIALRNVDHSLWRNTLVFEDNFCDCWRCSGNYRLAVWVDRQPKLWYDKCGSCIYKVALQITRLHMMWGKGAPPHLIYTLQELAK